MASDCLDENEYKVNGGKGARNKGLEEVLSFLQPSVVL